MYIPIGTRSGPGPRPTPPALPPPREEVEIEEIRIEEPSPSPPSDVSTDSTEETVLEEGTTTADIHHA